MIPTAVTSGVKLIGIHGKAGVGKNTVSDFLCGSYKGYYEEAFADPLKQTAAVAFGIPITYFLDRDLKETPHPYWNKSPREILQSLGTEMFRNYLGSDFWIRRMAGRVNNDLLPEDVGAYDEQDTVVIPDVRFQNEYDWIIANDGHIIHLTRPDISQVGIPGHSSESDINLHNLERTFTCDNDGTIAQLQRKIANYIISISI